MTSMNYQNQRSTRPARAWRSDGQPSARRAIRRTAIAPAPLEPCDCTEWARGHDQSRRASAHASPEHTHASQPCQGAVSPGSIALAAHLERLRECIRMAVDDGLRAGLCRGRREVREGLRRGLHRVWRLHRAPGLRGERYAPLVWTSPHMQTITHARRTTRRAPRPRRAATHRHAQLVAPRTCDARDMPRHSDIEWRTRAMIAPRVAPAHDASSHHTSSRPMGHAVSSICTSSVSPLISASIPRYTEYSCLASAARSYPLPCRVAVTRS